MDLLLVRNLLAWKIGNGRNVGIGTNPWIGVDGMYRLSDRIFLESLDVKGFSLSLMQLTLIEAIFGIMDGWMQGNRVGWIRGSYIH